MFVHYQGTKASFIEKGYPAQYERQIVFITGADGKGECIYTRGKYFANFSDLVENLSYLKGLKTNTVENVEETLDVSGGAYVKLSVSERLKLITEKIKNIDDEGKLVSEDISVSLDLSEDFVTRVNNLKARVLTDDEDIVEIIDTSEEKDGSEITLKVSVVNDELTESTKKTWSIDKIKSSIEALRLKAGIATDIIDDKENGGISVNILTDQTSIVINSENQLTVSQVDGGNY